MNKLEFNRHFIYAYEMEGVDPPNTEDADRFWSQAWAHDEDLVLIEVKTEPFKGLWLCYAQWIVPDPYFYDEDLYEEEVAQFGCKTFYEIEVNGRTVVSTKIDSDEEVFFGFKLAEEELAALDVLAHHDAQDIMAALSTSIARDGSLDLGSIYPVESE